MDEAVQYEQKSMRPQATNTNLPVAQTGVEGASEYTSLAQKNGVEHRPHQAPTKITKVCCLIASLI